jgi:hypothetical protein
MGGNLPVSLGKPAGDHLPTVRQMAVEAVGVHSKQGTSVVEDPLFMQKILEKFCALSGHEFKVPGIGSLNFQYGFDIRIGVYRDVVQPWHQMMGVVQNIMGIVL